MAERRVPVAMTIDKRGALFVVCDDGTVWELDEAKSPEWTEAWPAVPGTEADVSPPDDD